MVTLTGGNSAREVPGEASYQQVQTEQDNDNEVEQDTGAGVESNTSDSESSTDLAVVDKKAPVGLRPCFSARCCCHCCYVCQFLIYLIVFPLWAKWLVTSPMPVQYWHEQFPEFPRLKDVFRNRVAAMGDPSFYGHEIEMSPVPTSPSSCDYSCGGGEPHADALMNFEVSLTLNDTYLPKVKAHTTYPVLMASIDFEDWWIVSDRRHAHPHAFWASRSFSEGQVFAYTTDQCTIPPSKGQSYTTGATYVLACITWNVGKMEDLLSTFQKMEEDPSRTIDTEDLGTKCDAIGGVCGWPCGSDLNSALLPGCSEEGVIQVTESSLAGLEVSDAEFAGRVEMQACEDQAHEGKKDGKAPAPDGSCVTSVLPLPKWKCHHCRKAPQDEDEDWRRLRRLRAAHDRRLRGGRLRNASVGVPRALGAGSALAGGGIALPAAGGLLPLASPAPLPLGASVGLPTAGTAEAKGVDGDGDGDSDGADGAAGADGADGDGAEDGDGGADGDEDTDGDEGEQAPRGGSIYASLPRFVVKLRGVKIPEGVEVLSSPRAFILHASPDSRSEAPASWHKLYGTYASSVPPTPVEPGKQLEPVDPDEDFQPLPVLSQDTKHAMQLEQQNRLVMRSEWCFGPRGPLYLVACAVNQSAYAGNFKFKAGQKVAPPPFNDRCLAISGRCALACMNDQGQHMNYCNEDGYINITHLMGPIETEKNQTLPVWLFVFTLLTGFAVKVVMLCPGLFRPYPFKHGYEPQLTAQLRYIATCTCSAGENKCTVLRNLIGVVSCMPRDCRCRYHVVFSDEGHRADQKVMWQKLCGVLMAIPDFGGSSYEENVMQFFQMWVEETKKLDLHKLDDSGAKVIEQSIMDRMCGKAVLKKLRREVGWCSKDDEQAFSALDGACQDLEVTLREKKSTKLNIHRDDCEDWGPADQASLPLRMHYLARAKPLEDERTVPAQHVAPGTWFYRVPPDARMEDWLSLRANATEYVYAIDGQGDMDFNVPLRTSRGKAGGLNFCENYLTVYAERPENFFGDDRDDAPCLFSICDARHQFQQDFFHTTLPYFYDELGELNTNVAFTQCPQHFHEMQDKLDYLDNNNAAFFRLNCMVRNCCGGVSSCGTNGTWMIKHRDNSTIWESEKKRVRDVDRRRRAHVVERRVFHESCKVEDTASSLQAVLLGRRSQFINRRLSYGMAKDPENYLAAVQRWAEGGVVLSLQTFLSCHHGVYMVWLTFLFFLLFLASLFRLVSSDAWFLVQTGVLNQETIDGYADPTISTILDFCMAHASEYWKLRPEAVKDMVIMVFQFAIWFAGLVLVMVFVLFATMVARAFRRRCCLFPDEMRWWARLLISMDNLTYFFWFWTSFFWIGFNYYSVFAQKSYHFRAEGMFTFMLVVNALNWGMTIASALRYQLEESMESNEVIYLTLDNVWRSTQLFYMTAPLQLYSIIEGVRDYLRYQFYGEDISFWSGGDRGVMSKELVKYWTLMLIIGALSAWIFYFAFGGMQQQGAISACLIVTIIAMDVLHPCAYLWVGNAKLTREEAKEMSWYQALTSQRWWARRLYALILNPVMTGILRWFNPVWQLSMPFICLWLPYIGVNQAFMMLGTNTLR